MQLIKVMVWRLGEFHTRSNEFIKGGPNPTAMYFSPAHIVGVSTWQEVTLIHLDNQANYYVDESVESLVARLHKVEELRV